jgi:putative FmdB family regulatory protein
VEERIVPRGLNPSGCARNSSPRALLGDNPARFLLARPRHVRRKPMPIYAYKCDDCGTEVEKLQKISDPPLTDCPDCGAPSLAKQLTAAGFQLKGSGWYATDFKGNGATAKKDGETKTDTTPAANDSKPSDGKPAETKAADAKAAAPACGTGACAACS